MYPSCGGTKEGTARPTWSGGGIRKFFTEAVVTFELSLERLCCSLDRSGVGRVPWVQGTAQAKAQR